MTQQIPIIQTKKKIFFCQRPNIFFFFLQNMQFDPKTPVWCQFAPPNKYLRKDSEITRLQHPTAGVTLLKCSLSPILFLPSVPQQTVISTWVEGIT